MKFIKFNIFILLFLTVLFCIPSVLFAETEEKTEKTYPLDRDGKVYLENVSGDIAVKTWQKNEIKILARKTAREKSSLDKVKIDINRTDSNIRIITRRDKSPDLYQPTTEVSVFYDLFIPDKAQLRVKTISGRVQAWEIGGRTDIETVSGRTEIVKAGQGVKCKTISGEINLEEITGSATLKSTSGKIIVDGLKGSVEANSVSGDIEIKELSSADEIEMETIKGSMEVQGELSPGGIYEFHTISGRTRLVLAPLSNFELETNTISGDIQCDFKLNAYAIFTRNKLQGVVGKGGSSLKISSVSGDILINRGI